MILMKTMKTLSGKLKLDKKLKIEGKQGLEQEVYYEQLTHRDSRSSRPTQKFVPSRTKSNLWRKAWTDNSWNQQDVRNQSLGGRRFGENPNNRGCYDYRDRSSST